MHSHINLILGLLIHSSLVGNLDVTFDCTPCLRFYMGRGLGCETYLSESIGWESFMWSDLGSLQVSTCLNIMFDYLEEDIMTTHSQKVFITRHSERLLEIIML